MTSEIEYVKHGAIARLRKFLNAAGAEGFVLDGVDGGDLFMEIFNFEDKIDHRFALAALASSASDKQEAVAKDARQRFIDRDPVQVSERTRELARQALATRDNDTRTDEEIAEAGAAFICDTRFDAPVIAAPLAQSAEQDRIDAERLGELTKTLSNILHDYTTAMQAALIEWKHGKGAEAGFDWIINTLDGPGLLPDFDAEHGTNAQFWFSANCADPMPKCFCGNPSNTLWMGQGFCCKEHYAEAKAKYDAAIDRAMQDKEGSNGNG